MLSAFRKVLPNEDCIFFGDTKNMPYGEKTKEQLISYSEKAFEFFEKMDVKAVVMACNTTSAVVYEELKDKYNFKLYPLIQSVAKILSGMKLKSVGVFATSATVNSKAYSKNINKYNPSTKVIEIDCPQWVKFVENDMVNSIEARVSVEKHLEKMLSFSPEKIVLGCTHYPFLTEVLSMYADEDMFINPADIYVDFIKDDLKKHNMLNPSEKNGIDKFYVSSEPDKFIAAGKRFYDVKDCKLVS